MNAITKATAYAKLAKIKTEGRDTSKYIRMLAKSDTVPYDVIVFINKNIRLEQFSTYNHIYENRNKNPLYKNIVNENASIEDRALALSSILTQTIIQSKKLNEDSKQDNYNIMNSGDILEALNEYIVYGNPDKVIEVSSGIRDLFKKLYS